MSGMRSKKRAHPMAPARKQADACCGLMVRAIGNAAHFSNAGRLSGLPSRKSSLNIHSAFHP
jgi:hypothetical protein